MKKSLIFILLSACIMLAGCFLGNSLSDSSLTNESAVSVATPLADLRLVVKQTDDLKAALRAAGSIVATLELKLINYGDSVNPYTLIRKKADLTSTETSVSFTVSSVPVVSTIASLVLEGANIGGKKEFHGGIDLVPGPNTITLVASGSGEIEDVAARVAILSANDYSTMQKISAATLASIKETAATLSVADQQSAEKVFSSYKAKIAATSIIDLSAGESHSLVLRDDGTFAGFGSNTYGQLGIQGSSLQLERKFVAFHSLVSQVAAGGDFSLLLAKTGKVYACGNNDVGQLGGAVVSLSAYPLEIANLPVISKISAGISHALALDASGNLYAWGKNSDGQLGAGATSSSELPQQVATNVKEAVAGSNFTLILKNDGTVWGAGDNRSAQMAANIGDNSSSFVQIPGLSGVASLAVGASHCLALKTDGTVLAWGANFSGQTGLGATSIALVIEAPTLISSLSNIAQIEAGSNHSMVRTISGALFGFGDNSTSQLAESSSTASRSIPFQLASPVSVTLLSAGGNHNLAESTTTFSWGANNAGQLGNGQTSVTGLAVPVERAITW